MLHILHIGVILSRGRNTEWTQRLTQTHLNPVAAGHARGVMKPNGKCVMPGVGGLRAAHMVARIRTGTRLRAPARCAYSRHGTEKTGQGKDMATARVQEAEVLHVLRDGRAVMPIHV